jgi:hypothetical protein
VSVGVALARRLIDVINESIVTLGVAPDRPVEQRGAVHEFGHMLGLDDEYTAGSPFAADRPAIMNAGEQLRPRYDDTLVGWLNRKLKSVRIE